MKPRSPASKGFRDFDAAPPALGIDRVPCFPFRLSPANSQKGLEEIPSISSKPFLHVSVLQGVGGQVSVL